MTFHRLASGKSKVMLQLEFNPERFVEHVGDQLGIMKARTIGDLRRFKQFIESQGSETGAWRGEVDQDKD